MVDFVSGRAVFDAAHRKRDKYMAKCVAIGYGFLPFSFSYLGELEADTVTLLKLIRKFSIAQDIRARVVVHIFNRISFAIAKGIRHRFLRENVQKETSSFKCVASEDNIIDILSLPLNHESLNYLCLGLGMMEHIP
ncbi:hypothetical protein Tco_1025179 [Tanacetum coccineum]